MTDRNHTFKCVLKGKSTKFSIQEDLQPEMVELRNNYLDIEKEILKVNPTALVSVTSQSYLPVILVRHQNKIKNVILIEEEMPFNSLQPPFNALQPSDRQPVH